MPRTPFIGVRISCDMSATNCDLNLDCRSDCCCRRKKVGDGCRRQIWLFVLLGLCSRSMQRKMLHQRQWEQRQQYYLVYCSKASEMCSTSRQAADTLMPTSRRPIFAMAMSICTRAMIITGYGGSLISSHAGKNGSHGMRDQLCELRCCIHTHTKRDEYGQWKTRIDDWDQERGSRSVKSLLKVFRRKRLISRNVFSIGTPAKRTYVSYKTFTNKQKSTVQKHPRCTSVLLHTHTHTNTPLRAPLASLASAAAVCTPTKRARRKTHTPRREARTPPDPS